jgi:hypothetical protein
MEQIVVVVKRRKKTIKYGPTVFSEQKMVDNDKL